MVYHKFNIIINSITGQNPASSFVAAQKVIKMLGKNSERYRKDLFMINYSDKHQKLL